MPGFTINLTNKPTIVMKPRRPLSIVFLLLITCSAAVHAAPLKLHNIFTDHMVIQRDKPIKVWGWAKPDKSVTVQLGKDTLETEVQAAAPVDVFGHEQDYAGLGRWQVTFPARDASTKPIKLVVSSGDENLVLEDILVGDVWVMSGQSNMAFPLNKTDGRRLAAQAHLPMLRLFSIGVNEQATLQDDIRPETITTGGWVVSSPETASDFSAIGYVFGANVQRALQIPIGLIKNARGGASIESMVPAQKFDENPLAKRHADYIRKKMAEFDPEVEADVIWGRQKARAKSKGKPEPPRPDPKKLRSWNVPGKSPSHMASIHNGMFGVFKGFNIKGVVFHQGYNNQMDSTCRPKLYRALMKLMVEGIREDFKDPTLPFGVIGFCAGGRIQNEENFEVYSRDNGPWIREAQRLGLADIGDPDHTEYIPPYDVQIPGLHPGKKRDLGWRAALWALAEIYQGKQQGKPATLLSAEPKGDVMVLKFDHRVKPDGNTIREGFSIAGEDGKFYKAYAKQAEFEGNYWTNGDREIHVWSPLVDKPVSVRYAWANSPMGNLKMDGNQDLPFPSFRTDSWDFPANYDDFSERALSRELSNTMKKDAQARLEYRRMEEARRAVEILERLKTLGQKTKKQATTK
ncbi:MAG: sialate O-acetylesterase [Verrucomicrobiae bacterium]|nr:sialate O-acetylesterase [Verrucomicrobiae bacterium]NNJ86692.1 hypothetical protein [Akkermansiaceae bacterium]